MTMAMDRLLSGNIKPLIVIGALAVLSSLWMYRRARKRSQLPPGPPLEPLIGGLRTMPTSFQWLTFSEWAQKWGTLDLPSVFCFLFLNYFQET